MSLFNSTNSCDCNTSEGKHIKGISCDVRNCVHHDGDCYCAAEKIAIGPSYATSCSDTVCATFKQKQN